MSICSVAAPRIGSQSRRNVRKFVSPGFLFVAGLFLAVVIVEAIVIAVGAPRIPDLATLYSTVT